MDTHFSATTPFAGGGAIRSFGPAGADGPAQTGGSTITPTILGTGNTAGLLDSLGTGSSGATGSSGGSSLVNALQGLAQLLLGGGGGSGGSGFQLSLPQYQPMAKPNEHDTSDIAPSPAGGGGDD
ncbi:MAG TPA: hypothetical protein VMD91_06225 [Candidatus Sulfotelmatobacter sp.]|nr:hypothetical protein [Candidatus Sulfotelmatobacter sp.]